MWAWKGRNAALESCHGWPVPLPPCSAAFKEHVRAPSCPSPGWAQVDSCPARLVQEVFWGPALSNRSQLGASSILSLYIREVEKAAVWSQPLWPREAPLLCDQGWTHGSGQKGTRWHLFQGQCSGTLAEWPSVLVLSLPGVARCQAAQKMTRPPCWPSRNRHLQTQQCFLQFNV